MQSKGWAIIENYELLVSTVSPTRRGALVNFLVAVRGIMVHDHMSDDVIEAMWIKKKNLARVVNVTIIST